MLVRPAIAATFLILIALSAGGSRAATEHGDVVRSAEYYEGALSLFRKGDYRSAVIQLKNALAQNSNNLPARILMGRTYLALGDGAEAEKQLKIARGAGADNALILEPLGRAYLLQSKYNLLLDEIRVGYRHPEIKAAILFLRGQADLELGHLNDAKQMFDDSIALQPDRVETLLGLARLRLRLGQIDDAAKVANRALQLAPRDADAWYVTGDVLRNRRDFKAALTHYDKAIELADQHIAARISRAALLIDLGEYDKAEKDVKFVRTRVADDPYSTYLYALILGHQGKRAKMDEALRDATRQLDALSLEDIMNHPHAILVRGVISFARGQYDDAYPYLSRYVELMPQHIGARTLLGKILMRRNEPQLAVRMLKPAAELAPDDVALLALLGDAYLKSGDYTAANQTFRKALALSPDEASLRKRLGLSLLALGENNKAASEFRHLVSNDTGVGQAGVLLAMVQLKEGHYADALKTARLLMRRDPTNPFPYNLAGIVHAKREDYAKARDNFSEALRIAPGYFPAGFNLSAIDVRERKYTAAKKRLESILRTHPTETRALIELAAIAEREADLTTAIKQLIEVRRIDDKLLGPQLHLIDLYLRTNQFREAISSAEDLENSFPGNYRVLEAWARTHVAAGDIAKAVDIYRAAALGRNLKSPQLMHIAQQQIALHDFDGARNTLKGVIAQSPDYLAAHRALIQLEVQDGGVDKALEMAHALQTAYPRSAIGDVLTGDVLLRAGRYAAALDAYRKASAKHESAILALRIYKARLKAGQSKAALDELQVWQSKHPPNPAVRRVLAAAYMTRGQTDRAIRAHEALAKENPKDAAVLNNLALLYLRKRDARAIGLARKALNLAPTQPAFLDTCGWVLVQFGQPAAGLRLLRDAQARASTNPEVGYHVAFALYRLGRRDEALRALDAVITGATRSFKDATAARALRDRLATK